MQTKDSGKTKTISVNTNAGNHPGVLLGVIKWGATWRRYCFYPSANCQFDTACLIDITEFITKLMSDRKL